MKKNRHGIFSNLKNDLPASVVVFFVALPLCLGIALASGAPLLSGLIAGVIGGIVVGSISKSSLGVSGPAAGLAVIVLGGIADLGSFEAFLVAGVIAGVLQIIFGLLRAGKLAMLFPSSVITGMLTGIGIIIFLKQIPHLFGYDADVEGDFAFFQQDGETTFSEFGNIFRFFSPGAIVLSVISLAILIIWQLKPIQKNKVLSIIPGPLLVVVSSILLALSFGETGMFAISSEHFVNIPIEDSWAGMAQHIKLPAWEYITDYRVWTLGAVIALVASVETLLCVEATDKLDPHYKHSTPTNRELIAQGIGNVMACMIGGIPITQVIVRSSANIQAGGRTKASAILHGILLLVAVLLIPFLLNMIPIAALAAVLTIVGYKLAKPSTFINMYKQGWVQFVPFIATVVFMLFTDLLKGVAIGFVISAIFILFKAYANYIEVSKAEKDGTLGSKFKLFFHKAFGSFMEISNSEVKGTQTMKIKLINNVTFLSKSKLLSQFNKAPEHSMVIVDTRQAHYMHPDIYTMLEEFELLALHKKVRYEVIKETEELKN
ncbi:MAG: MFS superfamily sulfate permease-like transporter [Parvicellaceae bacterium]